MLRHWVADPSTCAYLPDQHSSLEYRLMVEVSPEEMDALLERGWRRFGLAYFRPNCAACSACVPLRVPVHNFRPSKQQKRVLKNTAHLRLEIGPPKVDDQRLDLYHRWHAMQREARGWPEDRIDSEEYYHQFAFPHPCVREFAYYDDRGGSPRLVALAIVDETPRSVSAVYTYHEPEFAKLSLGTASVLFQIAQAKAWQKRWLYLGYRVQGCMSSQYKGKFQPHELMQDFVEFHQSPRWELNEGRWQKPKPANS